MRGETGVLLPNLSHSPVTTEGAQVGGERNGEESGDGL